MDGKMTEAGEAYELRFERMIDRAIEKVWAALTIPERIADWLTDCEIEPRVGGRYTLRFRNPTYEMNGIIRVIEPPKLLEYTWPEPGHPANSIVRFLLVPHERGCLLRLTQTWPQHKREDLSSILAGWHMHLDRMQQSIAGAATAFDPVAEPALAKEYAAQLH